MKVVTPIDTTPSLFISWFALHNTPRYMAAWYYDETSPMQITFARILIGLENPKSSPSIGFEADKFILFTMWPMFSFPTITLSPEDRLVAQAANGLRLLCMPKQSYVCPCHYWRGISSRSCSIVLPPYREDKSHALDCWCSQQKLPADESCKFSMGSTFRITGLTSAAHNAPSE